MNPMEAWKLTLFHAFTTNKATKWRFVWNININISTNNNSFFKHINSIQYSLYRSAISSPLDRLIVATSY